MEFTVGIITYNRSEYVSQLIDSLLEQTRPPDEIIVVDDSTTDDTQRRIEERASELEAESMSFRYVRRDGDADAIQQSSRNAIIEMAAGDVVCFLDDDTICPEGWLRSICDTYARRPDIAGLGGPSIKTNENLTPVRELLESDDNQNFVNEFGEVVEKSGFWVPSEPVETDAFRGANMTFKTDILREVGGFDTRYRGPATFEEWDVMVRIRQRDHTLLYDPGALNYHIETKDGGSRAKLEARTPGSYWYSKNDLLFRRKNFSERFYRSLFRIAFREQPNGLPPLWKRSMGAITGDLHDFYWLKGYCSGMKSTLT